MRDVELVVFDLAGTTIQDTGQVAGAFTAALQSYGVAVPAEELRAWRGASKREALRHFLGRRPGDEGRPDRLEQVYAAFRDHLRHRLASEGVRAVPGAEDTFAWLRARR